MLTKLGHQTTRNLRVGRVVESAVTESQQAAVATVSRVSTRELGRKQRY